MKTRIIVFISFPIIIVLLFCFVNSLVPRNKVIAKRSDFDKKEFLILLFPAKENDFVKRAVIANLDEYEAESIEVYEDSEAAVMAKNRLTAVPNGQECSGYIKQLNEKLTLWGTETDWSGIEYAFSTVGDEVTAVMTVTDKNGTVTEYKYFISGSFIQPISIIKKINIVKKLAN